jgi:hypothetical protein
MCRARFFFDDETARRRESGSAVVCNCSSRLIAIRSRHAD